ncbi:MAG: hypothetical protein U0800_23830 [Isosphaeraceae bacterium]
MDLGGAGADVAVLCPLDRSDPARGIGDPDPPWPYIVVLDRRYAGRSEDEPVRIDPAGLPDFQRDRELKRADVGPRGGRFAAYRRSAKPTSSSSPTAARLAARLATGRP